MPVSDLPEILRQNYLFTTLAHADLEALASRFSIMVFQLGEPVIRRGEAGDGFYLILSGKARVVHDTGTGRPITVAVLGSGDGFGEQALFHDRPRTHTVRAASTLTVLKLSASDFKALLAAHPALAATVDARIRQNTEFNFLKQLGLLAHLSPAKTQELLAELQRVQLKDGEVLFKEGDAGDSAVLLREGRLRVIKSNGGPARQLALLEPGALIGEMSLLHGTPRSATVVALGDAVVLRMSDRVFEKYVATDDSRELIVQQAANRLQQTETLLLDEPTEPGAQSRKPELRVQAVTLGRGWLAPRYPFVPTDVPALSGLACLAMIDRFHGRQPLPEHDIDRELQQTTQPTLVSLARKAEERGYFTRLVRLAEHDLEAVSVPAVAEMNDGTFAVLWRMTAKHTVIARPLVDLRKVPRDEFASSWTGRLMTLTIVPAFGEISGRTRAVFRQFLSLARPFQTVLLAIGAITLMTQVFGLAEPLFTKVIIDKVLVSGDRSLLYLLLLGSLLVTGFQLAAGSLREYLIAHVMRRLNALLQLRFFHHILMLPQKTVVRWTVGDLLLRFGENEKLLALVSQSGVKILLDSTAIVLYSVVLFTQNGRLAAVGTGFMAAFAVLMVASSPRLRAADRKVFARRQATESHVVETVSGIQTVKSLAIEDTTFERGYGLITDLQIDERRFASLSFNIGLISDLLSQSSTIVILGYGATLAIDGKVTTGELVAFNAIFGAMLAPVMGLVKVWDELQEVRVSFERTGEILREPVEEAPREAVAPLINGHIVFRNVSFRYAPDQPNVLTDLNLEVLPGQKVALVGRSGSGKTTLGSLLVNLYQPSEGSILVDQIDIGQIPKPVLRRQLGVVEQQPFLFSGTIRENIAKVEPGADLERIVAAATLAGAHGFISELPLGYDTPIGERGMTLSGGQRQRLVIARAILGNPRILILDEATSALDTESEGIIQRNLDTVMAGRSTLVIAHRLSTVRNADVIVVMDQGRIVETGTHAELMDRRGLYYYLNASAA